MKNKTISIIFFSDTHLGFDYPLRTRVIKERRGEDFFKNFEAVLLYSIDKNVDLIIHGGDLFFRSKVPDSIVDRVYQTLSTFANHQIPVYIVPGNHERSRLPISLFLNHPLIHIFERPRIFSGNINNSRIIIGGFPFIREDIRGKFHTILDQSGWYSQYPDIKILVFHQAVEGATVGPGTFTFRNSKDVIPFSLLPQDASAILCGHIHRKQILHRTTDKLTSPIPVIFSGSTERTSIAEMNESKGFFHLTFENTKKQNWVIKKPLFIKLPTRPMRDISIDSEFSVHPSDSYLKTRIRGYPSLLSP